MTITARYRTAGTCMITAVMTGLAMMPAAAAPARSLAPASVKTSAGSFLQVAGVPHSSDVFGIAYVTTSQGTSELPVRRHHGKWHAMSPTNGQFATVASAGSKDTWIGGTNDGEDYNVPVIDHWNGKRFVAQHISAQNGMVTTLAASSAKNAWAAGDMFYGVNQSAEHWNGHKWSPVNLHITDQVAALATSSADNAIAIEASYQSPGYAVLRWNGKRWKKSLTAPTGVTFTGVATTSSKASIVVGSKTGSAGASTTYIERSTGKKWSKVKTPAVLAAAVLNSVSGHGKDFWAVGEGITKSGADDTLILHSTNGGKSWKSQSSPIHDDSTFASVSAVSSKTAYLAGSYRSAPIDEPVTAFATFNGHTWKSSSSAL